MGITRRKRKWWAALAIVALAFLSVRPACEVWLSHAKWHDVAQLSAMHAAVSHEAPAHDATCCASIEGAKFVKPADSVLPSVALTPAIALLARTALRVAVASLRTPTTSVIPPGNPPFYARSARILR